MNTYQQFMDELSTIKENQLERTTTVVSNQNQKQCIYQGKEVLNLISNDYLGIAVNRKLFQEFLSNHDNLSAGATSSRLLGGTSIAHQQLEEKLSDIFQKKALVFNSGYHANSGIIPVIVNHKDIIFCDRLVHASIIDGIKLSGAKIIRYNHLNTTDLKNKLEKHRLHYRRSLIITETLFSMDGDIPNLAQLITLKKQYDSLLMLDEAHSFGLFGQQGYGITLQQQLKDFDILIGTFGKAIGSIGAFVIANETIISLILNKSRSFIYSTALPPINIYWTLHVITNILPAMTPQRNKLQETAQLFRDELKKRKIAAIGSTQIIPIITGEINKTIKLSYKLLENGFLVLPIRPPTVHKDKCRLRLTLNSSMNNSDLEPLIDILAKSLS